MDDATLFGVFQPLAAQLCGQQNGSNFALQSDFHHAVSRRLHGDVLQLADPDTRGAESFQQEQQPYVAPRLGCAQQPLAFGAGQLPL